MQTNVREKGKKREVQIRSTTVQQMFLSSYASRNDYFPTPTALPQEKKNGRKKADVEEDDSFHLHSIPTYVYQIMVRAMRL